MHGSVRTSCLVGLLGAWLALGLASWLSAGASFAVAERLAGSHGVATDARWRAALADGADARAVARYQAAEWNRWAFAAVTRGQVAMAGLALALAAWPPRLPRRVVAFLLGATVAALLLVAVIVPRTAELGHALAFAPRPLPADLAGVGRAMGRLHVAFGVVDLLKTGLLVATFVVLARLRAPGARAAGDAG